MGAAKTGSGKTLAFLIPVVEMINKLGFMQRNGKTLNSVALCKTVHNCMNGRFCMSVNLLYLYYMSFYFKCLSSHN